MREIDVNSLLTLKGARPRLTVQQYRTLRGQVLAGDAAGAMRGLQKTLDRKGSEPRGHTVRQSPGRRPW